MNNKIPSDKVFETFEKMFQTRIDVAKQLIEAFNDSINVEWFLLSRLNDILWQADQDKDVQCKETKDGR